jgi:hypothetical protein
MKRAIVWFCWGERFIDEAIDSARRAAAIEADRVLITDAEGATYVNGNTVFTSIVQTQLIHANNLEKSRLVDLLPDGYDTFLYLDTDAKIVGDVSLGFAKASQHGIAMAPAPNYNLAEFFNFASIMRELGIEPADQIMYNAGVIFFHLTAAVRQVLERWRDLCAAVGAKNDFPRDQPFLNLALEQCGVTPYVLSPLYNYRGLGEYAVGNIRIWHSHFAPPPDLNDFENVWPARRFADGMRLESDENRSHADRRRPQAMSELSLAHLGGQLSPRAARKIAAEALAIQPGRGSRGANDFVLNQIGIRGSPDNSDSYFAEAMHYHLGLLHAHAGNPTEMAPHLTDSHTMPTSESDLLFSDQVNLSHVLRDRQLAAMKRGLPPILIACMPRSASATLTYTLAVPGRRRHHPGSFRRERLQPRPCCEGAAHAISLCSSAIRAPPRARKCIISPGDATAAASRWRGVSSGSAPEISYRGCKAGSIAPITRNCRCASTGSLTARFAGIPAPSCARSLACLAPTTRRSPPLPMRIRSRRSACTSSMATTMRGAEKSTLRTATCFGRPARRR